MWGDGVYTHDSDIVPVLIHQGFYRNKIERPPSPIAEVQCVLKFEPGRTYYPSATRNRLCSRMWKCTEGCAGSYSVSVVKLCTKSWCHLVTFNICRLIYWLMTLLCILDGPVLLVEFFVLMPLHHWFNSIASRLKIVGWKRSMVQGFHWQQPQITFDLCLPLLQRPLIELWIHDQLQLVLKGVKGMVISILYFLYCWGLQILDWLQVIHVWKCLLLEYDMNPNSLYEIMLCFALSTTFIANSLSFCAWCYAFRFSPEVAFMFNLCNEPWRKYCLDTIADRGLKQWQWTSARLHSEVLYMESSRWALSGVNMIAISAMLFRRANSYCLAQGLKEYHSIVQLWIDNCCLLERFFLVLHCCPQLYLNFLV